MPFVTVGSLKYFAFDSFPKDKIGHGIFTRLGGVSPDPWRSLNMGGLVNDPKENIIENRRRLFNSINRPVESLFDVWQVHSADIMCTRDPRPLDETHRKADGILTDNPDVTLLMRFADCVPVVLFDASKKVVGLVHAGWQGTVKEIAGEAVQQMRVQYGCLPGDILAGIGPSIGADHYEVGEDVISRVEAVFGEYASQLLTHRNQTHAHLDLWLANKWVLEKNGVKNIEIAGICTACHTEDWFSHRGEKGKTGRFGAVIYLKN
jgi:polyphenol oxidase